MCPAYRFPSVPPQLMSVSGVLSLHFPHPPAEPRLAFLASSRLQTDLFTNITDDSIAQTLDPVLSACSQVHQFTFETNRMISVLVNHTLFNKARLSEKALIGQKFWKCHAPSHICILSPASCTHF